MGSWAEGHREKVQPLLASCSALDLGFEYDVACSCSSRDDVLSVLVWEDPQAQKPEQGGTVEAQNLETQKHPQESCIGNPGTDCP